MNHEIQIIDTINLPYFFFPVEEVDVNPYEQKLEIIYHFRQNDVVCQTTFQVMTHEETGDIMLHNGDNMYPLLVLAGFGGPTVLNILQRLNFRNHISMETMDLPVPIMILHRSLRQIDAYSFMLFDTQNTLQFVRDMNLAEQRG